MIEKNKMNNYWISWVSEEKFGEFELHFPWWVSGSRGSDDAGILCAAVKAENKQLAAKLIYMAYDVVPEKIEFRFFEPRPLNWSPFTTRFQKSDWMKWE